MPSQPRLNACIWRSLLHHLPSGMPILAAPSLAQIQGNESSDKDSRFQKGGNGRAVWSAFEIPIRPTSQYRQICALYLFMAITVRATTFVGKTPL